MSQPIETQTGHSGLRDFGFILLAILSVNLVTASIVVPDGLARLVIQIISALLLALPVIGFFRAGDHNWTPKLAIGMLVGGIATQVVANLVNGSLSGPGIAKSGLVAVANIGLMVWCLALGALLVTMIKDKNLLLPISVFLAAFDIFLVLTPVGPTQILMKKAPQLLPSVGYTIPNVATDKTLGPVGAFAYVGPADFIFMAMFFIAIYRYKMKPKQTMLALIPTLILYLIFVQFVGPLPALVPIGLCVILVNLSEFKLTKDEWISTGVLTALMVVVIAWGATRPKPPAEPVTPPVSEPVPESGGLPGQVTPN